MPRLNINEGFDKHYNDDVNDKVVYNAYDMTYDDIEPEDDLSEYADKLFICKSDDNCSEKVSDCYEMYLERLNKFKDNKKQLKSDLNDIRKLAFKQMSKNEAIDLEDRYCKLIDDCQDITEAIDSQKVKQYNYALGLAKKMNKPVVYGYTTVRYPDKFYEIEPVVYDGDDKAFRKRYSANIIYVAYPNKGYITESKNIGIN